MSRKSLRIAKVDANKKSMEGMAYTKHCELIQKKNEFMANLIPGRYYLARCNMIAEQLNKNDVQEKIDGFAKTEELMKAEYGMMRLQAITRMRNAHFAKKELMDKFGVSEIEIDKMVADFHEGPIIREDYGDEFRRPSKAEFIVDAESQKS